MYIHKVKWQKYILKNIREMVLSWAKLIGQNLYHTIRWGWDWMGVGVIQRTKPMVCALALILFTFWMSLKNMIVYKTKQNCPIRKLNNALICKLLIVVTMKFTVKYSLLSGIVCAGGFTGSLPRELQCYSWQGHSDLAVWHQIFVFLQRSEMSVGLPGCFFVSGLLRSLTLCGPVHLSAF